ncbi:MAG: hypothetical protein ACOCRA_03755, partial [Halobacteria archaeon]
VMEARDECTRPKVVRRSIHLTPFGVDFCRVCLPLGVLSEDASSVYHPPDRLNGDADVRQDDERGVEDGRRDGNRDRGRDARDRRNGDTIRNPHLDDHWE